MSRIFVSYSRGDRGLIDSLLASLRVRALSYWLDESDILPAMEFNTRILEGLVHCDWFLLVMTSRSAGSEYVKDELQWALANRNGRILPVMLEKCDPAAFHLRMLRIQYVDLTADNQAGTEQLERALRLVHNAGPEQSLPLNTHGENGELELIALLLTFIPRYHQRHLRNLLAEPDSEAQSYVGGRYVRHELRDLCGWGLLERRPTRVVAELAADGRRFRLSDLVNLTEIGRRLAPRVS